MKLLLMGGLLPALPFCANDDQFITFKWFGYTGTYNNLFHKLNLYVEKEPYLAIKQFQCQRQLLLFDTKNYKKCYLEWLLNPF